ncbi:MAG: hypothetical protein M3R51_07340 [Candidatus Eremiobacteraeota bacterium]|nr:hypothetical protein [Candidatus Eremiobacteraeota bacterium]
MRTLRNLFIPAALVAAIAIPYGASAQTTPIAPVSAPASCGEHRGSGHNPMRRIRLTPAQHAQIKQIRESFRSQYPCGSKPPRQARTQMRNQILNILTPAQRAQYEANSRPA